jgi:cytidine deaminase
VFARVRRNTSFKKVKYNDIRVDYLFINKSFGEVVMEDEKLVRLAITAKEKAYAPYSDFRVGAALETVSGKLYTGCNIENASFGATICAERTAAAKAVSDGEKEFKAIAVASDSIDTVFPCGICRQVLAEFGSEDMKVICTKNSGEYEVYRLKELLPNAFIKIGGNR